VHMLSPISASDAGQPGAASARSATGARKVAVFSGIDAAHFAAKFLILISEIRFYPRFIN